MRRLAAILLALLLALPAGAAPPRERLLVIGDSLAGGLYASSADAGFAYVLAEGLGADLGVLRAPTVADARAALPGWGWAPDLIVVEQFPKLEGRQMIMMIAPGKKKAGSAKPASEAAPAATA